MILYFAPVPGNSESGLLQQYFLSALGCGQKCQFLQPKSCHLNYCTPDLMSLWDAEEKYIGIKAKIEDFPWIEA